MRAGEQGLVKEHSDESRRAGPCEGPAGMKDPTDRLYLPGADWGPAWGRLGTCLGQTVPVWGRLGTYLGQTGDLPGADLPGDNMGSRQC